jgi:uncharacterized protein YoaH (UPF0181 family)
MAGGRPVNPVERVRELRKDGVSPHDALKTAMAEAREASGHNDTSKK